MPTNDIQDSIRRNMIWKCTSQYLKHYRMTLFEDLYNYNEKVGKLVNLYKKTDFLIQNEGFYISKREFIQKIKDLEKEE